MSNMRAKMRLQSVKNVETCEFLEFVAVGPKGSILKMGQMRTTPMPNLPPRQRLR